jgi:N-acetylglucosaminyldiphosphoundecaprenol N-acetyl-beta-D-mannosaminyltransferase
MSAHASAKTWAKAPFRQTRRPDERIQLLGQTMDLVKPSEVFHFVARQLDKGERTIVANHNIHSLVIARKNRDFQKFFSAADLVQVDSVPLIFWAQLTGGRGRRFHRCTYLDWRDEFWARAQADSWRVFFVGGEPGVGERARERILERWPEVRLEVHHGYFDAGRDSPENQALHKAIAAFRPHILLVGMGMPRQELWVMQNLHRLESCAIFTVGGAFDYEAGIQAACPRWIGRVGAEWLFRLALNPKRLGRRYLVEPFSLLDVAGRDLFRLAARKLAGRRRSARRHAPAPLTMGSPLPLRPLATTRTPPPVVGLGAEPARREAGFMK